MPRRQDSTRAGKRRLLELEGESAGVDSSELEQVVDERAERPHLLAQRRQVPLRIGKPVLERLEHRLHVRERRPQVVARPGDELAARVEEPLDVGGHLVEARGELGQLGRAVLRGACRQVAASEGGRRRADALDRATDPASDEQRSGERGRRGRHRHEEDRHVVAGAEHRDAGERHGGEGQADGGERERDELQADAAETREQDSRDQPGAEGCDRHDDREGDHGAVRLALAVGRDGGEKR